MKPAKPGPYLYLDAAGGEPQRVELVDANGVLAVRFSGMNGDGDGEYIPLDDLAGSFEPLWLPGMSPYDQPEREWKPAAEITSEIGQMVHADPAVKASGATIPIPDPVPLTIPDVDGCNWTVARVGNSTGFASVIVRAIARARAKWNLRV